MKVIDRKERFVILLRRC